MIYVLALKERYPGVNHIVSYLGGSGSAGPSACPRVRQLKTGFRPDDIFETGNLSLTPVELLVQETGAGGSVARARAGC